MNAILCAEQVVRTLPGELPVTLVNNVSVEFERGEFVCIMGPSGSGKSSLLYLLGLLDVPTSGRIWLDGMDTSGIGEERMTDARLDKIGFVFQYHFLLSEFTVLDNVLLPIRKLGRLNEADAAQRAQQLLDNLGIGEQASKLPHQLSGGQRQRVAIARALANDPPMILADEPTGNLDSAASANVREILRGLSKDMGKTVIAVTHDGNFASGADRRIGLVDGHIDMNWRPT